MRSMRLTQSERDFIAAHSTDDVHELALHTKPQPDFNLPLVLDQIAGRQIAQRKLPQWAEHSGIIYPPHLAMEQCSSQFTAQCKARIAAELTSDAAHPTSLVDLTGGFGVDFSYMARDFDAATYVERQESLCELAEHNLRELGLAHVNVVHSDGVEYLRAMPPATLIYLDPARRDEHGSRTYAIEDCTPNVLELRDLLLGKAPVVMIKLSPMLDWRKTVDDFAGAASQLIITASANECKEIVVVLERGRHEQVRITCVNDSQHLEFTVGTDDFASAQAATLVDPNDLPAQQYLYEPNAAIMKAGAFRELQREFAGTDLKQIGANSHLFVSTQAIREFPGRAFVIDAIGTLNKRELKALLTGVERANITVRNFPLTAQQLRKKLKLKDGGDAYIFATTVAGRHVLLRTHKLAH